LQLLKYLNEYIINKNITFLLMKKRFRQFGKIVQRSVKAQIALYKKQGYISKDIVRFLYLNYYMMIMFKETDN